MCLVTVRIKLTAYNKRLVNPYVSIQIEKKIEILYDLKFKKEKPLDNHQMAILLVLSKVSQDKDFIPFKERRSLILSIV